MPRLRDVGFGLLLLAAAGLAGVMPAGATPPLERKAKAAGYPATDCTYCHAFTMDHMNKKALEMHIAPMNCNACHGHQLPLRGSALYNDRGRWLLAEKRRLQVEEVDVTWLRSYAPSPSPSPGARPRP